MDKYKELFKEEYKKSQEARAELNKMPNIDLHNRASNGWSEFQEYCFYEFIENSLPIYKTIAETCKENNITHVYDIGCCIAFQAKLFQVLRIKYTGIETSKWSIEESPQGKNIQYIHKAYPFPIHIEDPEHTAAISNLCIGYLIDPAEKAYEQMAKNFRYFCGHPGPNGFQQFKKLYNVTKTVQDKTDKYLTIIFAQTKN